MNSKKENDFELNLWTEKMCIFFEQNIDQVTEVYKKYGIHGIKNFAAKVGKCIGEYQALRSYWFSDGALSLDIQDDYAPVKPADHKDFLAYIDYLAHQEMEFDYWETHECENDYGKKCFSSYRKQFKFICRKAKNDARIQHDLENMLSYLEDIAKATNNTHSIECMEIFRAHYLEGKSINNIIANYPYAMYESEIHRRLDHAIDDMLIHCLKYPDEYEIGLQEYIAEHQQEYENYKQYYLGEL